VAKTGLSTAKRADSRRRKRFSSAIQIAILDGKQVLGGNAVDRKPT